MAKEEFILDAKGMNLITIRPNYPNSMWRNFSGNETKFNAAGKLFFTVDINDMGLVNTLKDRGFPVKEYFNPERPDLETKYYLQIKLKFTEYGPHIVQYVEGSKEGVEITSETVSGLDTADITDCIIKIRPYDWTSANGSGVSAWLSEMAIQVSPNRFSEAFAQRFQNN